MNDQLEFLDFVVRRLDAARVPYMLTGSVAMSLCYISAEAVAEAIARGGMFNVIHNEGVAKADFIVRRDDEYRQVEFSRRQRKRIAEFDVSVVAREDFPAHVRGGF